MSGMCMVPKLLSKGSIAMVKKESSIKVSMLSKDLHQYVLNQMELYQSCIGRCYFIVT